MRLPRPRAIPAVLVLAALALPAGAQGASSSSSLRPRADGSVAAGHGVPRVERRAALRVGGPARSRAWLTFRVRQGAASARLRLFVLGGSPRTRVTVSAVPESLLRRALTARGRPPGTVLGTLTRARRGRWATVRVSGATGTAGLVRLVLSTTGRGTRLFSSREGRHAPRLVLGPAPAVGTTPSPAPAPVIAPLLPAPTRFVSPAGNDGGACTAAAPCRSFDRAYHVASPGEVVEVAGGSYPGQTFTPDPGKSGAGCESAASIAACVNFQPAAGAVAALNGLGFGVGGRALGPAGIAIFAAPDRQITVASSTAFFQAREVVMVGVSQRNLYIAGSDDVTIRGGDVGGVVSPEGTHPEIQRVYGTNPLVVPTNLTIEGVYFHDINTSHPTAHTDCLQIENGVGIVLRGNRFERCGSVGLRMSYGVDTGVAPPTNVLIENNVFGPCADIPLSRCFFSAQPGQGINVVVRNNSSPQAFQPADSPSQAQGVSYVGNVATGVACQSGVTYSHNVWQQGRCSSADRQVSSLGFVNAGAGDYRLAPGSPAIDFGDPASFPATDIDGVARPKGAGPDAGAYESG
ncbi:MAG: hypothetical protein QOG70_2239 [Solirubrobacteraceae bacterium]|jgi:hypothetical protein|nr:hypothetical protein [Solirubrobacteraceae bacterium]